MRLSKILWQYRRLVLSYRYRMFMICTDKYSLKKKEETVCRNIFLQSLYDVQLQENDLQFGKTANIQLLHVFQDLSVFKRMCRQRRCLPKNINRHFMETEISSDYVRSLNSYLCQISSGCV